MQHKKVFAVNAAPRAALSYIADFRTLTEWEPSVQRAEQTAGQGPGSGAAYAIIMRFAGRESGMTYECRTFADDHAVLNGTGDGFTAVDRIDVRPLGAGCEVTYSTDIQLQTLFGRLLEPLIALLFAINARRAAKQLQQRLNA